MDNTTVTYVIPAMEPDRLLERPAPVTLRNLGPSGQGIDVELRGTTRDVLAFVAEHWGEEESRAAGRSLGATPDDVHAALDPLHAYEVATLADSLQRYVKETLADEVDAIEDDETTPPDGTSDYDGRAKAFTFYRRERSFRVLIEDVTLDPEHVAPGIEP